MSCSSDVWGFRRDFDYLGLKEIEMIGYFSVSVKFLLDGCGPLWLSIVYGLNNPLLRKDFWVELLRHFWPFFSFMVCGW